MRTGYVLAGLSMLAVSMTPLAAHATNIVNNGSFETLTTPLAAGSKRYFSGVTGWTNSNSGALTFIASPGSATTTTGPQGQNTFAVYPGFPSTSPDGGNFVMADGDPSYSSTISQLLTGLTVGAQYSVTFDQAAGQQNGFTGPTTELWKVGFSDATTSQYQTSPKFSLAQGATGAWQSVTMVFQATSASETLSFLAQGTPSGAPPVSFLDGVDVEAVPEPMTLSLLGAGLAGLGFLRVRGRRGASA